MKALLFTLVALCSSVVNAADFKWDATYLGNHAYDVKIVTPPCYSNVMTGYETQNFAYDNVRMFPSNHPGEHTTYKRWTPGSCFTQVRLSFYNSEFQITSGYTHNPLNPPRVGQKFSNSRPGRLDYIDETDPVVKDLKRQIAVLQEQIRILKFNLENR